ncbi:DUF3108 domain-containing protein [Xanthobacter autotrophicus]|uniref:DUF3108 domain-containing protein n=1 Tax=Xanthobacter autotrophicus TaxID=280 RepID=UPI0024A70C4B|nr:DUF3108 domain-containing protein [Xanthobacter autotrophicus]MDI4658610.1 DUF3108 domain-containing protein [Xanthobacter autotrophicus]
MTTARSAFLSARFPVAAGALLGAAVFAGTLLAWPGAARADGRLEAKYTLTVGSVELGRGSIVVEAGDTAYEITGAARVTGVLRAVSSGKGVAASRGVLSGGRMAPRIYAMNAEADGKAETARITIAGGAVKDMDVEPPLKPVPDRVPLTPDALQNVIDPMSGAFILVPGTADLISAAACDRSIPVFDGRQRYDLKLSFLRTEKVKTEGYAGPAVVCGVRYSPIAGHRPTRSTVKYMEENKDMQVWLVPIAGTRLLAPFKVSVATMIGTAVLAASSFETQAKSGTVPVNAPRP